MYIPNHFLSTDKNEVVAFMQQHSFATIISATENLPVATHLPFVVSIKEEQVVLTSHFAKANKQWQDIIENQVLVIFSEPHAYISPSHYDNERNVPTWNYFSVHAYGIGKLLTDTAQTMKVLEQTICTYEAGYLQQWNRLPEEYKLKMIKGIVAFEIVVTELQAKKKLSQNRTVAEQERIIATLSNSAEKNEQDIAAYMKQNLESSISAGSPHLPQHSS